MTADPYAQLAAMLERQLELAGHGRWEELQVLGDACATLIAQLPAVPPASAAAELRRASLIQARLEIELARGHQALLAASAAIDSGRRALDGYAPAAQRPQHISTDA
jgi:hypothetical protein